MVALEDVFTTTRDLINKCNLEIPEQGENAQALDAITVEEFYQKTISTSVGVKFANNLTRALLGVDADEISMLYFVNYCKSGCGIDSLISDAKGGAQYLRARQGKATTLCPEFTNVDGENTLTKTLLPLKECRISRVDCSLN